MYIVDRESWSRESENRKNAAFRHCRIRNVREKREPAVFKRFAEAGIVLPPVWSGGYVPVQSSADVPVRPLPFSMC